MTTDLLTPPTNDQEALALALVLSITAPTNELADEAAAIAEQLASRLIPEEVQEAKQRALAHLDEQEGAA